MKFWPDSRLRTKRFVKIRLFRTLGGSLCLGLAVIFGVWLRTLPAFVRLPCVGMR